MFKLIINTNNAAFEGEDRGFEICRILKKVIDRIQISGETEGRVRDINGNPVGEFNISQ